MVVIVKVKTLAKSRASGGSSGGASLREEGPRPAGRRRLGLVGGFCTKSTRGEGTGGVGRAAAGSGVAELHQRAVAPDVQAF
jgi:hypothetical protein